MKEQTFCPALVHYRSLLLARVLVGEPKIVNEARKKAFARTHPHSRKTNLHQQNGVRCVLCNNNGAIVVAVVARVVLCLGCVAVEPLLQVK